MSKALLHELGRSLSFGRLSLRAKVLWPMLLATSDDQGRGLAEPDTIKWYVCPNVQEIGMDDVPGLLDEMVAQGMIATYDGGERGLVYQIVKWWQYQRLQWARPSMFPAPEGWTDRIRYSDRGDYHENKWDTTGGFDAQPARRPKSKPASEPPKVLPRKPPRIQGGELAGLPTQPNLTELNLTTDSIEPADTAPAVPEPEKSADAPSSSPSKKTPMSVGLKFYLEQFGRKRFSTVAQRVALAECESEVGTDIFCNAVTWGAVSGIRNPNSIMTTARKMKREGSGNGRDPPATGPPKGPVIVSVPSPDWLRGANATSKATE